MNNHRTEEKKKTTGKKRKKSVQEKNKKSSPVRRQKKTRPKCYRITVYKRKNLTWRAIKRKRKARRMTSELQR
jgi:hypothetical protein